VGSTLNLSSFFGRGDGRTEIWFAMHKLLLHASKELCRRARVVRAVFKQAMGDGHLIKCLHSSKGGKDVIDPAPESRVVASLRPDDRAKTDLRQSGRAREREREGER
jgi:hypothetical protein